MVGSASDPICGPPISPNGISFAKCDSPRPPGHSAEPEGRHAPLAAEDQGAVIAAILADPTGHAGKVYPLYGAVELDSLEVAEIIGKTLGKEVRYEKTTPEQFVRETTGEENPFLAQHITEVATDHHNGLFSGMNDLVEKIGGRKPMTVVEFVEKNRAAFM